jgi:hypothetical protein
MCKINGMEVKTKETKYDFVNSSADVKKALNGSSKNEDLKKIICILADK